MALIYEVVKEEDRELFNSFVPSRKANINTKWVVDKERNIYFFWIGGEMRESEAVYFLSWNNFKINIYIELKCGNYAHVVIKRILLPDILRVKKEKIKEIVDIIPELLQLTFRRKIIFEEIPEVSFREKEN